MNDYGFAGLSYNTPRISGYEETIWSTWAKDERQLDFWPRETLSPEASRKLVAELETQVDAAIARWRDLHE